MQTVSVNEDLHEAELKIIHTVILLASADSYTIWCCRNSFNVSLVPEWCFFFCPKLEKFCRARVNKTRGQQWRDNYWDDSLMCICRNGKNLEQDEEEEKMGTTVCVRLFFRPYSHGGYLSLRSRSGWEDMLSLASPEKTMICEKSVGTLFIFQG